MDDNWQLPSNAIPAGYSTSSTTELTARIVFENLIRLHRIKPNLKENDKTPNFDGYLELTNPNGIPTGKIDVQLKTLPENYYDNPRFSYEKPFIAACFRNVQPSILIAVNIKDKIAYWHHIGMETIIEFFSVERKSHIIPFHPENVIDGSTEHYIDAWQGLYDLVLKSKQLSDTQKARIEYLEAEAKEVSQYVEIANLPGRLVQEIHKYLDIYNSLLEQDFKAIRNIIYPNYWKIGMAIGDYSPINLSYMMLPVPYTNNDPLIKQFKHLPTMDLFTLFQTHGIRSVVMRNDINPVSSFPLKYAYEQLKDDIISTTEKEQFAIDDSYAANEYLIGFIDNFTKYLGYEPFDPFYNLDDFKFLLETVLPTYEATNRHYRPGKYDFDHHIDGDINRRRNRSNQQVLQATKDRIAKGYTPSIRITLRSTIFNLELVSYYIKYLYAIGQKNIERCLLPNKLQRGVGMHEWQAWDRSILLNNIKTYVENYSRVYAGLIKRHFPNLSDQLSLEENADIVIFSILYEEDFGNPPLFQKFSLKAKEPLSEKRALFFHEKECPINYLDMCRKNDYKCQIEGKYFEVTTYSHTRFDFLFESTPVFVQSHKTLTEKMKSYLNNTIKSFG